MSLHIHSAAHDASKCFVCLVELTCGHIKHSRRQVWRVILQRSSRKFIWELALCQKEFLVSVIIGAESVGQDAQKKELKLREKMVKEKFADKSLAFSLHQVSSGGFLQMLGFVWACRPSVWQTSRKVQLRLWRPKRLCKKKHSIGWRLVHLSTHVSGFLCSVCCFFPPRLGCWFGRKTSSTVREKSRSTKRASEKLRPRLGSWSEGPMLNHFVLELICFYGQIASMPEGYATSQLLDGMKVRPSPQIHMSYVI